MYILVNMKIIIVHKGSKFWDNRENWSVRSENHTSTTRKLSYPNIRARSQTLTVRNTGWKNVIYKPAYNEQVLQHEPEIVPGLGAVRNIYIYIVCNNILLSIKFNLLSNWLS